MKTPDEAPEQTATGSGGPMQPESELDTLKHQLRWAQESQALAVRILALLSSETGASDAIREILGMVKEFTGFEAVGIRLSDGEDFPYFETKGFPGYFVDAESSLCSRTEAGELIRDSTGNPLLECMCGNVIQGRTNPTLPFFTEGGSFWSNSTTELLATTTEEERQSRTRNRCNGEGYESVALIPLRSDREVIGLLQLNDSRKDCFTLDMIHFFEGMGASIGIVLKRKRAEQDRDRLFNLSIDMLCIAGFDGYFKQVNPAFTNTLGWTSEELLSTPWIEFVHPEDREETIAAESRLMAGEPLYQFRTRCRDKNGTYRWISWNGFPMREEKLIFSVARDVTTQKQTEEDLIRARDELEKRVEERTFELKEANERLVAIFDSINHVIQVIDLETYEILYTNKFAQNLYGKELVGGLCYEELHGATGPCDYCPKEAVVKLAGEPYEWHYHNPTNQRDYLATDRTIKWTGGRAAKFHLAIDVTESKKAENLLRESERRFRDLADLLPQFIYEADHQGFFTFANQAALETTGYTWEHIEKGTHLLDIIVPEDAERAAHDLARLLDGEKIIGREYRIKTPEGGIVPVVSYSNPIERNGQIAGFRGVAVDLTERKQAEEDLRESEERYRSLFENMLEGFAYCKMLFEDGKPQDFIYMKVNDSFERLTGLKNVVGRKATDVIPGIRESNPELLEIYGRVALTGKSEKFETYVDGLGIWFSLSVYSPEREHLVAVFDNITEHKRAEEALRASEEKYRASFNNAAVGIDLVDRYGRFLEVNETLSDFLGYTRDELRNLTILDVTHPEDVDRSRDGHEAFLRGETESYRLEKRYLRKDGTVVWADTSVSAIQDRDGEYRATVGVIVDITKRKESEEALVRLATAVEQAAETIVIADTQGAMLYVNPAFEKTTGYSREEALGKNPRILQSGQHDGEFYKRMWETVSSGQVWSGHLINKRKDGALFEEEATISPIKDDSGKIVSYVAVKRDVTKEVSLQKQLHQAQKMEAIGTLAGGIAHDFNNLLQVTLGYSELLLSERPEGGPEYADLQRIHQAALSGADLVQRLLTFSRKIEPKPVPMSMNKQIKNVEKLLSRTIPKMIDIRLELGDDTQRINADPALVEQVLMNLAVNARDAMPEGGVLTITTQNVSLDKEYCTLHPEVGPGDYVMLSVSDTGHGMQEAVVDHIFEPFYTTKEIGRGTGLGLAMVYGIVKQHGGHITCQSRPGAGTAFQIYLPAIPTEAILDVSTGRDMPVGGTETILLVDDEETIRDLATRILERSGYRVLTAPNGKEALNVYGKEKGNISLVVLDLIMPEMGGKQCLEELLMLDPQVKVLVASGFSVEHQAKEGIGAAARGFIGKPYNMKQMLQTIREALDES